MIDAGALSVSRVSSDIALHVAETLGWSYRLARVKLDPPPENLGQDL